MVKVKREAISYDDAGMLAKLTRAYLRGDENISHLYDFESTIENVIHVIENKQKLSEPNRPVLTDALERQYTDFETSKIVTKNIQSLQNKNTYTITTGHQLNLFTGPLYFIYKIISVIKGAQVLSEKYPSYHFVPVYWMATEDHDFEEINHTYVNGERLEWQSDQTGMVGEFSTEGLGEVVSQLEQVLGNDLQNQELIQLVRKAYVEHSNLAAATRYFVNTLFEKDGLVILDGNDAKLKSLFSPIVKQELLEQKTVVLVNETVDSFPPIYAAQVTPREINLFYVVSGLRERIIYEDGKYKVNDTEIEFTEPEILQELKNYPERFSPNALMRPLYQELILPNVVYVGGGAEVAYWLELKSTFEFYGVSFPLLQIRDAFLVLEKKSAKKVLDCCLTIPQLFLPENEQIKILLKNDNPFQEKLTQHNSEVHQKIKGLLSELEEFDPELIKSLKSTKQGFLRELKKLDRKIMKSVKRKQGVKLDRLHSIRESIYPSGVFQERRVNYLEMASAYGDGFLRVIHENVSPFDDRMFILTVK